jgi:1,4-dihydroxy-6-naphthoate synthase
MRRHAQEFDDHVLMQHVDLYVNDWTLELGPTGRRALDALSTRAASVGVTATRLDVFVG